MVTPMKRKDSPHGSAGFLDKVLSRLGRLDGESLQVVVRRLERERRFLESLFNTIEDGVLVSDADGRIIYLNAAVTRLIGLHSENAEGELVTRYLPGFDWTRAAEMDQRGGRGVFRQEIEIHYPQPRFLRVFAAPMDGEAAGNSGLALILHDATEARKQTTEAIESERLHALTLLAGSVAHEIGNPLNALHIHLQLIEREIKRLSTLKPGRKATAKTPAASPEKVSPPDVETLTAKLQSYVGVCLGEVSRLDYIITEFLQAMRPTPPRFEPGSVNKVVEETLELLAPEIRNRGIHLNQSLGGGLPDVPLDPRQIKQVLVNLIKNAMQAMSRGGSLTLSTGTASDSVWITVADSGVGIAPELQRRIFEPFYTTKKKGTGLGLMIVERIMREHRGRVDLESEVGKGTTFKLWLPMSWESQRGTLLPPPSQSRV